MTSRTGRRLRALRRTSQILFGALFVALLPAAGGGTGTGFDPGSLFLHLDPLVAVAGLAGGTADPWFLLALAPIVLTLVFGRVFCGWACPLGSLNHLVSRLSGVRNRATGDGGLRRLKYAVLALVLAGLLLGTTVGSLIDPLPLLTRSAAVVVTPLAGSFSPTPSPPGDGVAPGERAISDPRPDPGGAAEASPPPTPPRVRAQAWAVGLLLLAVLLLNLFRPRFFCSHVCPLGALYALVARLGRGGLRSGAACDGCGACARACPQGDGPNGGAPRHECLVCGDCAAGCPQESVALGTAPGSGEAPRPDLGRRGLAGTIVSGAFLAALPAVAPAASARRRDFLRPPGALPEDEFLDRCVRCGSCIQACPTSFLQAAGLEAGPEALWTPVADPRLGYCADTCNRCTRACPTRAIRPLSLDEKRAFVIGGAVVDRDACYTHADGVDCDVCARHCPLPGRPLRFDEAEVLDYRGRRVRVRQLRVMPELCNGCGICQHVCPRRDRPGIAVTAEDEQRASAFPA